MDQNFSLNILLLLHACQLHPVLPETVLSALLDISDPLHGLHCLNVEIAVVLERLVPLFLEFENSVFDDLFVVEFATGFGPGKFAGVVFCFEVAVAFGSAEAEGFAVVAHEHDSVAGVDGS